MLPGIEVIRDQNGEAFLVGHRKGDQKEALAIF